jgi:hypothetical protein
MGLGPPVCGACLVIMRVDHDVKKPPFYSCPACGRHDERAKNICEYAEDVFNEIIERSNALAAKRSTTT